MADSVFKETREKQPKLRFKALCTYTHIRAPIAHRRWYVVAASFVREIMRRIQLVCGWHLIPPSRLHFEHARDVNARDERNSHAEESVFVSGVLESLILTTERIYTESRSTSLKEMSVCSNGNFVKFTDESFNVLNFPKFWSYRIGKRSDRFLSISFLFLRDVGISSTQSR